MFIALESLFHLQGERGYGRQLCKRIAYFLEPTDTRARKTVYDRFYDAADKRGRLVHGGTVDNDDIKNILIDLEPLVWRIGRVLLTGDKKWMKLFSSLDPKLARYFRIAESQPLS